jgi:hypothetical protein
VTIDLEAYRADLEKIFVPTILTPRERVISWLTRQASDETQLHHGQTRNDSQSRHVQSTYGSQTRHDLNNPTNRKQK